MDELKDKLTYYELQHLKAMIEQQGSVKYVFDEFVRVVSMLLMKWIENDGSKSVWVKNSSVEKAIEKELEALHDKLMLNISDNQVDAWRRSNLKADDMVRIYISNLAISDALKNGLLARNAQALQAFQRQKINGLTVSDRVWNVADTAKKNIEYYLSSGISVGRPAALISQDLRQMLNDPNKRFRRLRDDAGKLVYSKPMNDYHPGQGVYRSSYKNSLRLAVTETNMAYRASDYFRWLELPFVLGVDIRRSGNFKEYCPICDRLVGVYPKTFKFIGWHSFCVCQATPILMNEKEFAAYLNNGAFPASKEITKLPGVMSNYLTENRNALISSTPYWINDNSKLIKL